MLSYPPPNRQSLASFDQVTRPPPTPPLTHPPTHPPPKNASAPLGHPDARWPDIPVPQVRPIQYLVACKNRNDPCLATWSNAASPGVGFSAVAILGGGWPPPMAHRDYAGNIRSPHDDTPLCHQWQVILHTSDIVGRFDAFFRPSHSVSYQIYTGFYCVLFSLHTQLFILGFLLLLTRWKWSIYRICVWQLPNRNRAQSSVTCGYA